MSLIYCPPQNHLGSIYRLGHFHRFVNPGAWRLLVPFFDRPGPHVHLGQRATSLRLIALTTLDGYPVDAECRVFYTVDPRRIRDATFQIDALGFPAPQWHEIIHTGLRDLAANQVFPRFRLEEVFTPAVRQRIREQLSRGLAERLRDLGFEIDPAAGVSLQDLQHNPRLQGAFDQQLKAAPVGQANADRLRPLAALLHEVLLPDASMAYVWQVISTLQHSGRLPPQVGLLSQAAPPGICPRCGNSLQPPIVIGPEQPPPTEPELPQATGPARRPGLNPGPNAPRPQASPGGNP